MAEINRTQIALPKVVHAAAGGVKAVAEQVDNAFSHLTEQLRNFKAADASELSGVPASSVVSGSRGMYYQTFEDDITEDWILLGGSTSAITYPTNGRAGGRALRTTNRSVQLEDNTYIPLDPSRLYRMRIRIRDISGTHRDAQVGVREYDKDKAYLRNAYVAFEGTLSSTSWTTYTGYFKGVSGTGNANSPSTDASNPKYLHADTRYIRPWFGLSLGGNDQTAEIDYITIEVLTETSETNKLLTEVDGRAASDISSTVKAGSGVAENKVDHDSIEAGSISGGGHAGATKNHLIAGTIVAANIKANTITANEIFANTITVNELATLDGGGLTVDFAATGSDPVLDHAAFNLNADGSADFSGTVSASSFQAGTATFTGAMEIEGGSGDSLISMYAATHAGEEFGGIYLRNTGSYSQFFFEATDEYLHVGQLGGLGKPLYFDTTPIRSTLAIWESGWYTFSSGDTTPTIKYDSKWFKGNWKTNNSSSTTITDFDDAGASEDGLEVTVLVNDNNTTFDFTSSSLVGNGGVDYAASSGDVLRFKYYHSTTKWHLIGMASGYQSGDNASFGTLGASGAVTFSGSLEVDGAFNHDGSTFGVLGATPAVAQDVEEAVGMDTVSGSGDDSTINDNFDQLFTTLDDIQNLLSTFGFANLTGA